MMRVHFDCNKSNPVDLHIGPANFFVATYLASTQPINEWHRANKYSVLSIIMNANCLLDALWSRPSCWTCGLDIFFAAPIHTLCGDNATNIECSPM